MIYKSAVKEAITDARRFIRRAEQYLRESPYKEHEQDVWGGKDAAAMKRASMDVTRSMANLRQGRK